MRKVIFYVDALSSPDLPSAPARRRDGGIRDPMVVTVAEALPRIGLVIPMEGGVAIGVRVCHGGWCGLADFVPKHPGQRMCSACEDRRHLAKMRMHGLAYRRRKKEGGE